MADGSFAAQRALPLVPPLKWAGGKRWLVQRLQPVLNVPYVRLIEPFAGSAATFFRLRPSAALLADTNAELINVYRCLSINPDRVEDLLRKHASAHTKDYYYQVRAACPTGLYERAARMIYLNRTCWNALYRVNRKGQFNVPKGTKNAVLLPSDNFRAAGLALASVELRTAGYATTIRQARDGDLIFADPPYFSTSNTGTFTKYTHAKFGWSDQVRLAKCLKEAHSRGANFLLTNADAPELAALYGGYGHLVRVKRHSVISGSRSGRGEASELVWTSFPLEL